MWFTNLKTKYYNFNFICVDWLHTMSLMFYASVSSGVVYGYSHENKKRVYTERASSTWTMNHENVILIMVLDFVIRILLNVHVLAFVY